MNFKEALIAHLQGKKVQARLPDSFTSEEWEDLVDIHGTWNYSDDWKLCLLNGDFEGYAWEFRIAPRTILVNGVEVPAPEKDAPKDGDMYFLTQSDHDEYVDELVWSGHDCELRWLNRGLVYLNKEDAINRAKAMLITQEAV